ncbi:hypothetical protein ATANTOWER_007779 [Ataeniobius toweri]|uniref:Uncharacterized protein n=1 Tax=Ataeniobius toweri TaxID=208326 RepID=A0ABU7A0A2_9TELE|nr:hypothetical protein [Ataeniobius toweri]
MAGHPSTQKAEFMVQLWQLTPGSEEAKHHDVTITISDCYDARFSISSVGFTAGCNWTTSGKVHHCSMFSPFADNGSHCGVIESQSLRCGFVSRHRLIVNNFVIVVCF